MQKPQLIYIPGGEVFESSLSGLWSALKEGAKNLFKVKGVRWPDSLESELSNFEVTKLQMPRKNNAQYKAWQKHFEAQIPNLKDGVTLLGWSLGANFLAKYLSENDFPKSIKSVHLVAGCYGAQSGFELSKSFPGLLKNYAVHLYHSKDDFVVPFEDAEKYKTALPQAQLQVFEDRNHFLQTEFKELVDVIAASAKK